jgi:hypothetical protein
MILIATTSSLKPTQIGNNSLLELNSFDKRKLSSENLTKPLSNINQQKPLFNNNNNNNNKEQIKKSIKFFFISIEGTRCVHVSVFLNLKEFLLLFLRRKE